MTACMEEVAFWMKMNSWIQDTVRSWNEGGGNPSVKDEEKRGVKTGNGTFGLGTRWMG